MIILFLFLILLVHGFILTRLIYFPYPELFIYPYLTNHGLKPYSQILDQHFPGPMFLPINLDNLGMNTPEAARIWSIVIVLIIQIMLFVIGSKIFKNKTKALLINFLYLAWQPFFEGWILWIDNFLPLLLLPAFYALTKSRFFITGILLGISIIFKQVFIPLAIFAALYVFWKEKKIKPAAIFLIGVFIPIILMLIYFAYIGVLKDFWYWTVVFNLTTYAQFGRGIEPSAAHLTRVLVVFGSSLFVLRSIRSKEVQILLIFLIGALLGLSTRFDFVHFQPALPFAILATVYGLRRFVVIALYGLVAIWWMIIFYKGHLGDRVISFDTETLQLAAKVESYTNPQDKIFVFGGAPQLYQMTNTLPPGNVFVFQFPWFLKVAENRILEGIKKDQPNIIVSNRNALVEDLKISDFAKNIDQYILENYEKIDSVGNTEILRKK